VSDLGSPRKVWQAKHTASANAMAPLIFGAVLLAGGIVLAILQPHAALAVAPIGLMFMIFGVVMLRSARHSTSAIAEYDNGFAALVGGRRISGPWSAITSITSDEVFRARARQSLTYRTYHLAMQNGETFKLEVWLTEIDEIIKMIKANVARELLPPLKADYEDGKVVTFGGVKVSRDAIEAGERRLAWPEIANVTVKHGELLVTPKDGSAPVKVRASRIPNIEQLCELIGVKPPLDLRRFA
jgi:hypothetical protein